MLDEKYIQTINRKSGKNAKEILRQYSKFLGIIKKSETDRIKYTVIPEVKKWLNKIDKDKVNIKNNEIWRKILLYSYFAPSNTMRRSIILLLSKKSMLDNGKYPVEISINELKNCIQISEVSADHILRFFRWANLLDVHGKLNLKELKKFENELKVLEDNPAFRGIKEYLEIDWFLMWLWDSYLSKINGRIGSKKIMGDIKDDVCKKHNIACLKFDELIKQSLKIYPGTISLYSSSTYFSDITHKEPIIINGKNYYLMAMSNPYYISSLKENHIQKKLPLILEE